MLQVISDITGELADCTISKGVLGCDGIRRGAIADIDLFDLYDYQIDGVSLWEVRAKPEENTASKKTGPTKTVAELAALAAARVSLFGDE